MGFYPLATAIPWTKYPGTAQYVAPGKCSCDNYLLNLIADIFLEALPVIAEVCTLKNTTKLTLDISLTRQVGCYIIMSSLKMVLDIGLEFIGGVGKILDAGLGRFSHLAHSFMACPFASSVKTYL